MLTKINRINIIDIIFKNNSQKFASFVNSKIEDFFHDVPTVWRDLFVVYFRPRGQAKICMVDQKLSWLFDGQFVVEEWLKICLVDARQIDCMRKIYRTCNLDRCVAFEYF